MDSAMDISTSALVAQRTRLNTIASNIANMATVRNENGEIAPFKARHVVFQSDPNIQTSDGAIGVKVASVETEQVEPIYRWQPTHPYAIKSGKWEGYVAYPNVNMNEEFVDALTATRAYEANVGVIEVSKNLGQQTLRILA